MKSKLQKQEKGFTIIEVLIVLAIAGLIILIVFLAVPSLQRNSRNTQRKNDVSAVVGALQENVNNNNGKLPAGTTAAAEIARIKSNVKLSYYDPADIVIDTDDTVYTAQTLSDTQVFIKNFQKCDTASTASATGATKRSVVALYRVESGTGFQDQCQEL